MKHSQKRVWPPTYEGAALWCRTCGSWMAAKALRWDLRLVHTLSELPPHFLFLFVFSLPAIKLFCFVFTCNEGGSYTTFS